MIRLVRIENRTFKNCVTLHHVILDPLCPMAIIGSRAFEKCGQLYSIDIPKAVYKIESNAFDGCSSLESLYIPFVKVIENDAFNACSSLVNLTLSNKVKNENYTWEFFKGWIGIPPEFEITVQ